MIFITVQKTNVGDFALTEFIENKQNDAESYTGMISIVESSEDACSLPGVVSAFSKEQLKTLLDGVKNYKVKEIDCVSREFFNDYISTRSSDELLAVQEREAYNLFYHGVESMFLERMSELTGINYIDFTCETIIQAEIHKALIVNYSSMVSGLKKKLSTLEDIESLYNFNVKEELDKVFDHKNLNDSDYNFTYIKAKIDEWKKTKAPLNTNRKKSKKQKVKNFDSQEKLSESKIFSKRSELRSR